MDPKIPTSERLELLGRKQASWKDPILLSSLTIPLAGQCRIPRYWVEQSPNWEFCGGIFVRAYMPQLQTGLGVFDHEDPFATSFQNIDVLHINSAVSDVPSWTLRFNTEFTVFAVDPSQDLLVLVEKVYLLELHWYGFLLSLLSDSPGSIPFIKL